MSRKPSFANLRQTPAAPVTVAPDAGAGEGARASSTRAVSHESCKQIADFFSPEMSFAMYMLARRQERSLQALMVEAFNHVLRKHGESPIGV